MGWRVRVSAAAWMVVRDTHASEDIFQNVALKAMTREVTFESEASLLSWAFITARREGIDWLRRHRREALGLDESVLELLESDWQGGASKASGAKIEALQECFTMVSEPSRQLLKLRYFEGHSCEESAAQMGIGLEAVYKRLSRIHHTLKECVEKKLNPPGVAGPECQP